VAITVFSYLESNDVYFRFLIVIPILLATQFIDSRFTKNKEYSKSLHMSFFGNGLWLLTAVGGLAAHLILPSDSFSLIFLTEGMFIFASFRIGIYTTVFGFSIGKAWLICFIQPLAMFLALLPVDLWYSTLLDPVAIFYGLIFLGLATAWSLLTDRAGKPSFKSTHKLLQLYLTSKKQDDASEIECLMEEESKVSNVSTFQIKFHTQDSNFRLVLPDIHPGPFHPVGGSNIPYLIYKNFDSSAMIFHSVSDHSLNLPSKTQVHNYLKSFENCSISKQGSTGTEPVTVQINKARTVGLLFDKTCILFLSLSPYGMDDLPPVMKSEIEQFSKNRGFERVLIIDCHNAMGENISQNDAEDLLKAAKLNLDTLITKTTYPLEIGYSNSGDMNLSASDLALGGIGVLCFRINNKKYFFGWADANNMENGLREEIVEHFTKNGFNLLEVCTSDTHYSAEIVRTKMGYYQLGVITKPPQISDWFLEVAKKADKNLQSTTFEIMKHDTNVKVMGSTIFRDFSNALDKSMKITKVFLIASVSFFFLTMFL